MLHTIVPPNALGHNFSMGLGLQQFLLKRSNNVRLQASSGLIGTAVDILDILYICCNILASLGVSGT